MGTFTEHPLSGSDGGRPIGIDRNASPGTLLHTATDDPNGYDKIQLYVANTDSDAHVLYLQWGGVTATDLLPVNVPSGVGLVLTVPVLLLMGRSPALELRAYADTIDLLNATGYVLRAGAMGEVGFQDRTAP